MYKVYFIGLVMKTITCIVLSMGLLLSCPLLAVWGSNVMSIDAIKHFSPNNRIAHVRGTIVENLGYEGFSLIDDTGEIRVRFTNNDLRHFSFHNGMRVEVRGRIELEHQACDLEASAVQVLNTALIGHY